MDEKMDMKAIALVLAKSHVMVWINYEDEDDIGVVISSRDDAERINDLVEKKEPENFIEVVDLLRKAKILHAAKAWDEDDEDGFSVFELPDDDDDDDDEGSEVDDLQVDQTDIKQQYLLTLSDCPECVVWKKKYHKEIQSGKIVVLDAEKGKGKKIADILGIDECPTLVVCY